MSNLGNIDIKNKKLAKMKESKKIIVLNRMYAGSYLSTHLGHEVINMFQADNGKHYLYLNSRGNYDVKGLNAKDMLLVMHVGGKRVEILGLAKNLIPVPGAHCSLPSNINAKNSSIIKEQRDYILNEKGDDGGIHYGGVPLLNLFGTVGQQNVYVSYEVDKNSFFVPNRRQFICFDEADVREGDILLSENNFASTSLRQFIQDGNQDYDALMSVIENTDLWSVYNEKVVRGSYTPHTLSLFDICRMHHNENCFSDALAYYMKKYPKLWVGFFKDKLQIQISGNFTVSREVDTKVNDEKYKNDTGGRIDLLLSDENTFVVIENKIKSDINKIERDLGSNQSQLDRYENYIKYLIDNNKNQQTKYHAFVLSPDYNKPKLDYKKGFRTLTYSLICDYLKDKIDILGDADFKAFYYAMRRHSFEYESLCLYDDMKNIFYNRIEEYIQDKV